MEPSNIVRKWINRNWAFAATCAILAIGVAVLLLRSNEYAHHPAEAAVITIPTSNAAQPTAIVAGEATVIAPSDKANARLVSNP